MEDDFLMARLEKGDMEALESLFHRHSAGIMAIAMRLLRRKPDAEDITQEVFMKIWDYRNTYRPSGKFKPWAARVCLNLCRDRWRAAGSHCLPEDRLAEVAIVEPGPEGKVIEKQEFEQVAELFYHLPAEEQQLLSLRLDGRLSVPEIAEIMGCSIRTVHYRTDSAVTKLRRLLEGQS